MSVISNIAHDTEGKPLERLWNGNFVKVFTGNFMLFFAFYLIMPLLPLYLHDTFNADKQMTGLVLSGYTLTALIFRPFSGYIVDSFPRKKVLLWCYFLFFLFFAGYFATWSLILFAVIRTLHGAPFGMLTVASSTMAIDVLHPTRRAEGIGYYGLSNNLAMAIGPTAGLFLYEIVPNFDYIFLLSLITAGIGFAVDCTISPRQRQVIKRSPISLDRFLLVKGWLLGISIACLSFGFGVLSTYLAIYGREELGIMSGTGTFFMLLAVGLIVSRVIGGRSLRQGKITQNAAFGTVLSLCGYILFASVNHPVAYYATALIIGLGNGHMFPAYQSMFINLAENSQRGTANSTLLISWDVGVGLGVLAGGAVAESFGYHGAFVTAAAVNAVGVAIFYVKARQHFLKNRLR